MPFILGSANFLGNYGIEKVTKSVHPLEFLKILNQAHNFGISRIDTADSYPIAELFPTSNIQKINKFKIDSKINLGRQFTEDEFMQHVYKSIINLGVNNFECLYLHNLNPLMEPNIEITKRCLKRILDDGLAVKIGVSVYSEEEIKLSITKLPDFRTFQILENICDRRLYNSKYLSDLHNDGIELNIRSIFLQGLLLTEPNLIPSHLAGAKSIINEFDDIVTKINSSRLEFCVAYAKGIRWASNVVIGVGSLSELISITNVQMSLTKSQIEKIPKLPPKLKDPRNWKK